MFRFPTVLVLGAGASIPYGFPSGLALRDLLCSSELRNSIAGLYPKVEIQKFIDCFRDSNIVSIDAFLSRRSEFIDIGKAAIASVICAKENPCYFHDSIKDHWYFLLWNKIVTEINSLENLKKNQLKIITFNYDRSLEHFLVTSIMNTFDVNQEIALEALKCIPIIHFYGELGDGTSDSLSHFPYQVHSDTSKFLEASKGIRIIPEFRTDEQHLSIIKDWFLQARNILFLGYGFDPMNNARLGLKTTLEDQYGGTSPSINVMASAFGLTDAEVTLAQRQLTGNYFIWNPYQGKNSNTFREFADKLI